jgi:hypothetical protein
MKNRRRRLTRFFGKHFLAGWQAELRTNQVTLITVVWLGQAEVGPKLVQSYAHRPAAARRLS